MFILKTLICAEIILKVSETVYFAFMYISPCHEIRCIFVDQELNVKVPHVSGN